jgi:replicative DNA helicase
MSVPHDPIAERDTIGAMLLSADARIAGLEVGRAEDFYDQFWANVFLCIEQIWARGGNADVSTVAAEYETRYGEADRGRLLEAVTNVPVVSNVKDYVGIVARHAAARKVMALCAETANQAVQLADPYELAESLKADLDGMDTPADTDRCEAQSIDDLLTTAETDAPWLIPGMLRSDWRCLLVAGEGAGKSVILRQIAMLSAQGIHPFRFTPMDPIRTLIVDLENPVASIAETGARMVTQLRLTVGQDYEPSRCKVFRRPGGIDPRTRHDRGELEREIAAHRPDLVCIGPAYKMLHRRSQKGGMETHEEATDPVLQILDDLRTRYRFALMIEHHAPQGYGGSREMRPYGSQRWLAWPEIGLSMKRDLQQQNVWELDRHRGDRMTTEWPTTLSRGQVWPWTGTWRNNVMDTSPEYERI